MNLGFSEVAFILLLALLLLGPKRLPEVGRQVGRAMAEYRRATSHLQAQINAVSRSVEAAVDLPRLDPQSAFQLMTTAPAESAAAAAAHEEAHV